MEDELQVTWSSDVIIVPNEDLSRRELARLKRILVVPFSQREYDSVSMTIPCDRILKREGPSMHCFLKRVLSPFYNVGFRNSAFFITKGTSYLPTNIQRCSSEELVWALTFETFEGASSIGTRLTNSRTIVLVIDAFIDVLAIPIT